MAFQGRGRGGFRFGKQEEFELFPKLKELPDIVQVVTKEVKKIADSSDRLQSYWNSSPYYIKEVDPEKDESTALMRWFDVDARQKTEQKGEIADFIKCSAECVPAELAAQVSTDRRRTGKIRQRNVRWSQESDLQKKLDLFEKRERMSTEGQDEKATSAKGKKEDGKEEEEEEDDEKVEDEEEEEISDGDYNQNVDFDDDEDEFNMDDDDNDDQGIVKGKKALEDTSSFIGCLIL